MSKSYHFDADYYRDLTEQQRDAAEYASLNKKERRILRSKRTLMEDHANG